MFLFLDLSWVHVISAHLFLCFCASLLISLLIPDELCSLRFHVIIAMVTVCNGVSCCWWPGSLHRSSTSSFSLFLISAPGGKSQSSTPGSERRWCLNVPDSDAETVSLLFDICACTCFHCDNKNTAGQHECCMPRSILY